MNAIQNTENIVQQVKSYLSSRHMLAHERWIFGCVEYFVNEKYTLTDIKDEAYQQWLLNDLSYICPGSLPENVTRMGKIELSGKFVLQINSVLDISVPKYQQYLKLKKTDIENIKATMNPEEKISSKRMLKFELTDGKQILSGMEYETLSNIKTEDITPGCKALIIGPVLCRQGMLLLTNKSIKIIGGEVQDLMATHSLAAQLASMLNVPLIENDPEASRDITQISNGTNPGDSLSTAYNRSRNDDIQRQIPNLHPNPTHLNPGTTRNNSVVDDLHSNEFGKRPRETEAPQEKKMRLEVAPAEDVDPEWFEDDNFQLIEEYEQLHNVDSPIKISPEPFVYIKQINELSESEKRGKVFRVKAQIQKVVTKLTLTENQEWSLKCTIFDGTGLLDVEFSSNILSTFLGFTPENISELKKKVATDPNIKNNINLAYAKTRETLRTLYCIMQLTMNDLPKITRLIDFDESHVMSLQKRLNNEKLILKISLT